MPSGRNHEGPRSVYAQGAHHNGRAIQRREEGFNRADAFFVMRTVDNQSTPVIQRQALPPSRPSNFLQGRRCSLSVKRQARG